ncbi:MAG TPA: hypothetical protein VFV05_05815 [Methylomirabilota bacterium]|nr:hypothetical protein [Methylomirabilota bacterium]
MSSGGLPMRPVGDRHGQLVEALRRREAGAAELLVTKYQGRVYRLAIGITGNAPDAEVKTQVHRARSLIRTRSAESLSVAEFPGPSVKSPDQRTR